MEKLLFHSNSPLSPTGYGQQCALWLPRLKDHYDLACSAFYGIDGAPIGFQGVPVLPGLGTTHGNETIREHAKTFFGELRDGLVFTLLDVWILDPRVWRQVNTACWTPVDHQPLPPPIRGFFEESGAVPVAMSRFGERQLEGLDPLYVPHGIDCTVYKSIPKREAREATKLPQDAFVVGMVAANKGNPSRKCFAEAFQAFKALYDRHPEARLYVHTELTGKLFGGVDLPALMRTVGLDPEAVLFCDQYRAVHHPFPPSTMAQVFSSLDVLLMPSAGEGFGLPCIEAQACGVPVIVSDFSAQPELCGAGWTVSGRTVYTPLKAFQFLPDVEDILEALEAAYRLPKAGWDECAKKARLHAERYHADRVMNDFMLPALEQARERFEKPKVKPTMRVSIVTPWWNHSELQAEYERAIEGEGVYEAIIVDDGSDPPLENATLRVEKVGFSRACNIGLEYASGDAVLFLNNDIMLRRPGWLKTVCDALESGVLVGAQMRSDAHAAVDGESLPYLDGWCLAGMREDLLELGGWDEGYEEPSYYGDNDLCLRAREAGFKLVEVNVGLHHLIAHSSNGHQDLQAVKQRNYARYADKIRVAA